MNFKERRKLKRFSLKLPLQLRWKNGNAASEVHTRTHDLNSEHVGFCLSHEIELGCPVELVLALNHGDLRVFSTGQVVRCSKQPGALVQIVVFMKYLRFIDRENATDQFEICRKNFFGF